MIHVENIYAEVFGVECAKCHKHMNQSQVLELLKEIEDSIFNGVRFFANAHWLSHGRVLESVTAL